MNCSKCREIINGKYWTEDNKEYCSSCYEEIRLKCSSCKQNISGMYYTKDGSIYCEDCHNNTRLKCDLCNRNIDGKYFKSFEHNICQQCDRTHDNCDACNRYISSLTDGCIEYGDKRKICKICNKTAVKVRALYNHFEEMSEFMKSIGFTIGKYNNIMMMIVMKDQLDQFGDPRGICQYEGKTLNGKIVEQNFKIKILQGLPQIAYKGILVHELFHMWVKINTDDKLSKYQEEGIANLCQYIYLDKVKQTSRDSEEIKLSSYIIDSMMKDKDRNYGDGFREAKSIYDAQGIRGIMKYMN